MRVHVVVANRHGSTVEIAEEIAATLRRRGLTAETVEIECREVPELRLGPDDVVVLGSASTRRLLDRHDDELRRHRTFLFRSDTSGDAVDWDDVGRWADRIADQLRNAA